MHRLQRNWHASSTQAQLLIAENAMRHHTMLGSRLELDSAPASAALKFRRVSGTVRISVVNRRPGGESLTHEAFLRR